MKQKRARQGRPANTGATMRYWTAGRPAIRGSSSTASMVLGRSRPWFFGGPPGGFGLSLDFGYEAIAFLRDRRNKLFPILIFAQGPAQRMDRS